MSSTDDPIMVDGSPLAAQIAAALRVAIIVAGALCALAGHVKLFDSDTVNTLSAMVGPAASVLAFGIGQLVTRANAKKLISVARDPRVPDEVAQIRR